MVRRPPRGLFGGVWVFPGGTVDPGDYADGDSFVDHAFRRAAVRELAEEVAIDIEVDSLAFVSRWVTPSGYPRRYDTCFYLASLDASPPWRLAVDEIEAAAYISPVAALAAHQAEKWPMVLPTLAHLRWLAKFETIQQAVEATKAAKSDPVTPVVMEDGSLVSVDLPW
jgi:8-oxo-dGTP pyrophosphatase MutT (NUDIX family)